MSAQGPLAREMRDVRLGLEVLRQRRHARSLVGAAPLEWTPMTKPIKVALARIPADMDTDPEVALVRTAADYLASAGYEDIEADVQLAGTYSPCGTVLGTRTMSSVPSVFVCCSSVRDSPAVDFRLDRRRARRPSSQSTGYHRSYRRAGSCFPN
jgi:Asp-tRNA(Asn)/Glu-tRNA(Gln) amidotransferase A subunit family amidase